MTHPVRAAIHRILAERAASPAEMARVLDLDVPTVSHHCKYLVRLDCAELAYERKGARGSVEHVYRGTERHRIENGEWEKLAAENPELAEHLVGEYMQAIVDDFVASGRVPVGLDERWHITRTPTVLDDDGVEEARQIYADAEEAMLEVQRRVSARGGETEPYSSSLAFFRMPPPG